LNAPILNLHTPSADDELVFLPLGGSGEIGMNLNAYGYGPADDRKWLIVDVGVTFGGSDEPGIDLILPDPVYLAGFAEDIVGIVLTHAHEDHIGAVAHLWPQLKAPLYATPFTAAMLRDKLKEKGLEKAAPITIIPMKHRFTLGPFDLEMVTLTHSIPEPNGLAIRTPLGMVLHTGDWKIDPDPQIGDATDAEALTRIGDEGVLAMVCDSTNVFVEGVAGSEGDVRVEMTKLIGELRGKVAVACFASNVARLESVCVAAAAAGRSVCLVGRSMIRVTGCAKSVGMLQGVNFVSPEQAGFLPDNSILYLCTGSQGEERAALSRIARGDHPHLTLHSGDTVIFSSRQIPGNERSIARMQAQLEEQGVQVITDADRPIHVSGHPCRDELRQMYSWARPQIAIPVHGERRHILEHVKLARTLQVREAIAPRNGDLIRLAPGPAEIIDEVPSGRLYVDGEILVPADGPAVTERKKLAEEGHITVALCIDAKGRLVSGPDVRVAGLAERNPKDGEANLDALAEAAEEAFERLKAENRRNEDLVEEAVSRAVRRAADRIWRKRPFVDCVCLSL